MKVCLALRLSIYKCVCEYHEFCRAFVIDIDDSCFYELKLINFY